ncbi:hypothetical protein [Globicatella sanguinis]
MSEETIVTVFISIIPAVLVYLNEHRKLDTENSDTVYDKQKDWITKLESELKERDETIAELKRVVNDLEKRIKELENDKFNK